MVASKMCIFNDYKIILDYVHNYDYVFNYVLNKNFDLSHKDKMSLSGG